MDAIAQTHRAPAPLDALMRQLGELVAKHASHPARTVVLLPFIHLLQPAREAWARAVPDGFLPRFETSQTWSGGSWFEAAGEDFSGEISRDLLTAHSLL